MPRRRAPGRATRFPAAVHPVPALAVGRDADERLVVEALPEVEQLAQERRLVPICRELLVVHAAHLGEHGVIEVDEMLAIARRGELDRLLATRDPVAREEVVDVVLRCAFGHDPLRSPEVVIRWAG